LAEDVIAFAGVLLAVFAPVVISIVLVVFVIFFLWFFPKVMRAFIRMWRVVTAFFRGENLKDVARKAP
jgi:hypothetical protein